MYIYILYFKNMWYLESLIATFWISAPGIYRLTPGRPSCKIFKRIFKLWCEHVLLNASILAHCKRWAFSLQKSVLFCKFSLCRSWTPSKQDSGGEKHWDFLFSQHNKWRNITNLKSSYLRSWLSLSHPGWPGGDMADLKRLQPSDRKQHPNIT